MRLIIVRHGETRENTEDIMMGQTDGTLTHTGVEQAKRLAKRLRRENIDFIYSSDLSRTKDTLKEVLRDHKVPVIYDPLLREKHQGIFQGKSYEEYHTARAADKNRFWRPEGGENFYDVKRRVRKFMQNLQGNHSDTDNILIITHGGWKNTLLSYILNIPRERSFYIKFRNTAVTIVNIPKIGRPNFEIINCTKHLDKKK